MRILCLTQDFRPNPGGIATFLHNLCWQLCELGHQVDVLTPARDGDRQVDRHQPYRVYRYQEFIRLSSLPVVWQTISLHLQHHYDLVFVGHFMTTSALGALILRQLSAVPFVILSHGNDLFFSIATRTDGLAASWIKHHAAAMLGNSRFTAARIGEVGYRGPVEVLNPGVDTTLFHPHVDTTVVRQKYGLNGYRVLVTTARLVAKKNVDGVLQALSLVSERVPNVRYLIVGDGEEKARLEAMARQLGLGERVLFLGHLENSQLPPLYCASNLFVMASHEVKGNVETFGMSFVEAGACGLPVVGGRSGGIADAVIDGVTGLLVDPNSVNEIASGIVRLLTDGEMARRLGENGRLRAEQELSWKKVGERLDSVLRTLSKGKRTLAVQ